jgi:chromosome segregation ATPase
MQRSYSVSDQPYASSFQAIQNLNLNHLNGQVHENGNISPPENDQEHIELLHRIQSAIPDINRLLHGFRHTHTRLNSREAEIKQIGNQHEQALMHKDFYIEALQSQMKKTANESAEECAKLKNTINELRLELGDLQEKQKDLEDGLAGHQKSNEELSQSKSELEAEIEKLNASIKDAQETHEKELETQKEEHAKSLTTQKQELTELFEEIKAEDEKAAAETLEAREKELRDQHESSKEEWGKEKKLMDDTLETQRGELEATKTELASKIATLESKETELETQLAELNTTREEVASKVALLEAKEKELEETRQKNAQELEALQHGHAGELDTLRQSHDEQLAAAAKELNEKIAAIEAHFLEQEKHWEAERAALQKLLAERDEELNSAEREKDKLEGDGLVKEQQLQRAVEEMRSTIDHLDQDCDRLRRTLQSLGEATDLKTTKGDQFL